jgi:hypothetical protein
MLGYLNDATSPKNANPAFWGPLALIVKAQSVRISRNCAPQQHFAAWTGVAADSRARKTAN